MLRDLHVKPFVVIVIIPSTKWYIERFTPKNFTAELFDRLQ